MSKDIKTDGPGVEVRFSCTGCKHLQHGHYCDADDGRAIVHHTETPDWCPKLREAELETARSLLPPPGQGSAYWGIIEWTIGRENSLPILEWDFDDDGV